MLNKFDNAEVYAIAQNLNGTFIATCWGERNIRLCLFKSFVKW